MSRLWSQERAAAAVPLGSFVLPGRAPAFLAWNADAENASASEEPAAPEIDLAACEAEAFAAGLEQGRRDAERELAHEREALVRLTETLQALRPEPSDALAVLLAATVGQLVEQVVGDAGVDGQLLVARAEAAAALIADEVAPSKLRVHPADVALLAVASLPVPLVPDGTLRRGSVRLETATGWVEDGPDVRLAQLREQLARLGPAVHDAAPAAETEAPSPVHLARQELEARLRGEVEELAARSAQG